MNTFKFFLWLIKDFLIMGISVGTFCIGGLYTLYVFANDNTYFPLMTIYSGGRADKNIKIKVEL